MQKLSPSQRLFERGYTKYKSDVSIESILRSIMKLEAGLSALINNDDHLNEAAKTIYYSNIINFADQDLEDMCRETNKFFEFLQSGFAKEIEI